MNWFRNSLTGSDNPRLPAVIRGMRYWLAIPISASALILVFTTQGHGPLPCSAAVASTPGTMLACLPDAAAGATAFPSQALRRVDSLNLKAKGLPPNMELSVFMTELQVGRAGSLDYIGELQTNSDGRGAMRVDAVANDAVSGSSPDMEGRKVRRNLDRVVLRLSASVVGDLCFAPAIGQNPFSDGADEREDAPEFLRDVSHGSIASITTVLISDSRSSDDNVSLFHTLHWRFIKCVSTF